jgi:excisionase family DNA binding protein
MAQKTPSLDWMPIGEAAKYLGVSRDTLRRWEKRGKIKSYRTPGGRRRYTMYDLESAMKLRHPHHPVIRKIKKQKPPTPPTEKKPVIKPQAASQPVPKSLPVQKVSGILTKLLLTSIVVFVVLLTLSGLVRVLSPYLTSTREILNPVPETYSP